MMRSIIIPQNNLRPYQEGVSIFEDNAPAQKLKYVNHSIIESEDELELTRRRVFWPNLIVS